MLGVRTAVPAVALRKRHRTRSTIVWNVVKYLLLALILFFTVFPVYWIFASSFKPATDFFSVPPSFVFKPTLANYQKIFNQPTFLKYLQNSLIVAGSVTILALAVASLAAYALARYRFPGARFISLAILSARLVPGATMIIPYFALFRTFHLTDSILALIVAYTGFSLPFACWLLYGFFLELPIDMQDAARVDGCTEFAVFWRIALPLTLPGLGATAILVFLGAWNEFLFALVLAGREAKTLPVYLATFISEQTVFWGGLFATAVLMVIPTLILTLGVQRSLVRGLTAGAVKG
jgi:multiple sugar transport system permease protein